MSSNPFISNFKKDGKVKKLSEIYSVLSVKKIKISVGFSRAFQLSNWHGKIQPHDIPEPADGSLTGGESGKLLAFHISKWPREEMNVKMLCHIIMEFLRLENTS